MTKTDQLSLSPAIGFWKFVIFGTIGLSVLRAYMFGGSFWGGSRSSSMFWFAVVLYGVYRVARLQPWWPFQQPQPQAQDQARDQTKPPQNFKQPPIRVPMPPTASRVSKPATSQFKKRVIDIAPPPAPVPSLTPKELIVEQASNVGIRSRVVRHRVTRYKMERQKRRPH